MGLATSLFVLFLCAPALGASADPAPATPLRVVSGADALLAPKIAVDRHGIATVAWVERLSVAEDAAAEARVRLARAPDWVPVTVAATSAEGAGAIRLLLVADDETHLAWADPMHTPATVWRYTRDVTDAPQPWEGRVTYPAALATTPRGALQALWVDENGLVLVDAGATLTSSLALDMLVSPAELALSLDATGRAHAAWAGRPQIDAEPAIYYIALDADGAPTLVDPLGSAPRLAVGPGGTAHLCWERAEGLHCADSRDWGRIGLAAPGPVDERVALAVGPGDVAHVAWGAEGALWYANSGDWIATRRRLADVDPAAVSLAVDAAGRPHIAFTVATESGGSDLYVLVPFSPAPQLAIASPSPGSWLAEGERLTAVANLPASAWQRVAFYLRPEGGEDALIPVGTDYDGRDGWSAPLDAVPLDATIPYHVVAMGVDMQGDVTAAEAGPVTIRPGGAGDMWVLTPEPHAVHGEGEVRVMLPGVEADPVRIEVYLTASRCPPTPPPGEAACAIPSRTTLVASLAVDSSKVRPDREWVSIPYDSSTVPDGAYRVSVVAIDRDGGERFGVAAEPIVIDNTLAPVVRVTAPGAGAVLSGEFAVSAEASSPYGRVERVDFFAERQRPLLARGAGGVGQGVRVPETVWLAGDTDGSDGWSVTVAAGAALDGDAWVLRAVAYDVAGRATVARSEGAFTIVGRDRPVLRLDQPAPGETVRGVAIVTVEAVLGGDRVNGVTLHAQTAGGRLLPIGALEGRGRLWTIAWDTTRHPDGDYELLALAGHDDGRTSLVRGGVVHVANRTPDGFLAPRPGEALDGAVTVRLQGAAAGAVVPIYYRDAQGQLRTVGTATAAQGEWALTWDTAGVLDGPYDLVAAVPRAGGGVSFIERAIVVRHGVGPAWSASPEEGEIVRGVRTLAWEADDGARISVDLSLDGGVHWVTLADDREPSGSLEWDTTQQPDTPRAVLRLTAIGGAYPATVTSAPFGIDNENEPPRVALLAPSRGEALGAPVTIAWNAWDPDGDPLVADVSVRAGQGAWQLLADDLAGVASFTWDTRDLAPAADYRVRVSVRDADGAVATAEVDGLALLANRPPEVRLVAPNARAELRGDAVILWQADDPDDDPLSVDLYYSDDAGLTWLPLAEGIPNTGYYVWQVSFLPMGNRYRVRVVARDGFYQARDESDGVFVVGGMLPPTVALLEPAASSRMAGIALVRWDADVAPTDGYTATVELRMANDRTWQALTIQASDDGLYAWDTTSLSDGAYELRVTLEDDHGIVSASAVAPVTIANGRNARPGVAMLAPAGAAVWRGAHEVAWRAWDDDGDPLVATVAVSLDGGQSWEDLASVDASQGRLLWDTSALRGVRRALVRVTVNDGQVSAQDITPAPIFLVNGANVPAPRFRSPDDEGNLWRANIVTWEVGTVSDAPARVWLALSRDGGATWQDVAEALYDAGEAVVPPDLLTPGHIYRLRLIVDNGPFRVRTVSAPVEVAIAGREPPELTLERPAGGEVWSGREEIRWRAGEIDGRPLRIALELSRDGGATWFDLARDPAGESYAWDTTTVANGTYRLRITAGDGRAESVRVSPPFTVENPGRSVPIISLTAPRAHEVWSGTREIRWRVSDRDGGALLATLAYSLDGGGTWRRFAYNVPASEAYIWDTTTAPNCEAVWLRATVSDGLLSSDDYAGPFALRNPRAPIVTLLDPIGGEVWSGEQRIVWHVLHEPGRTAKTMLQYSLDRGRTWQTIAHDLPARGSYTWDTTTVPDYAAALVRAYVSDGQQSAVGTTRRPLRVRRPPDTTAPPFYLP